MTVERIQSARQLIDQARCIASFSGAGLSAESGVSTFRDAQTGGLWEKHDPMRLASPQGFAENPQLVIDWYCYRRRQIAQAQPNPAHRALAARSDIRHITQNVDDLLARAGAVNVTQVHGNIAIDVCHARCGHQESLDMNDPPGLRDCPACRAPMRPGVVWFGEMLPDDAWRKAEQACRECDVLLVIGTSAVVYPAAGLISLAQSHGAQLIVVNTQPSSASSIADVEIIGPAGTVVPQLLDR